LKNTVSGSKQLASGRNPPLAQAIVRISAKARLSN
jgi:hypothetical protein